MDRQLHQELFPGWLKKENKMAAVPVTIQALVYPKNKSVPPYPATIVGLASITGLEVGGGPVMPPDIKPDPPLVIWGGGNEPMPTPPIAGFLPDGTFPELPDKPPAQVEKPHAGWNWSVAKSQWYFLYVPGSGEAQPKK